MSLLDLRPNDQATITSIHASMPDDYRLRLIELGFAEGERVTCVRLTPFAGPPVYKIGDSVFSIASDVAALVEVERTAVR